VLARRGFAVDSSAALIETYRRIYTEARSNYDLYLLLEDLIDFDELFLLWRSRHVLMVERMIGNKIGTGGSSGAEYLQRTLAHRFFPELWEVRTFLGEGSYASS
jgi:tryptophan 2,3-dioxygenase